MVKSQTTVAANPENMTPKMPIVSHFKTRTSQQILNEVRKIGTLSILTNNVGFFCHVSIITVIFFVTNRYRNFQRVVMASQREHKRRPMCFRPVFHPRLNEHELVANVAWHQGRGPGDM